MKRLLNFIYEIFSVYSNSELTIENIQNIENVINLFIETNYIEIKKNKYFFIDECNNEGTLLVHIVDSFEEELQIHYPEKLI